MAPLLLAVALVASPQKQMRVVVLDLRGPPGISMDALTQAIPSTLVGLGPFVALSMNDLRAMASFEETRQIIGCQSNAACLAEIGGAVGAAFVITGELVKKDDGWTLQLQFINNQRVSVDARVERDYQGPAGGLIEEVRAATKLLVRDVLALRPGTLAVEAPEGASVAIDGKTLGVAPLPPQSVGGGLHTLTVEKDGFVRHRADVEIREAQTTTVQVALVPSEERRKERFGRAVAMRVGAFTGAALAVGAFVAGGVMLGVAGGQADVLSPRIDTYNTSTVRASSEEDALRRDAGQIARLEVASLVSFGVGAALAATSVVLFVVGESPGRYAPRSDVRMTWRIVPGPGTLAFVARF